MHAAQKSKLKFVNDKESNISPLWRQEKFLRICSKEDHQASGEGTGNRGDKTSQKKLRHTVQPPSNIFFRKSLLGQATRWGRNQ
jgi:hypothetical protein